MNENNINQSNIQTDHFDKESVFLRQAEANDIGALEQLLNCCYRETAGWTNEADLVGGIRITPDELANTIANPKHYLFVYPKTTSGEGEAEETGELLGCIAVDIKTNTDSNKKAYIGMFAVHPVLQGQGVGNVILQAAETFATRHLSSDGQADDRNPARLTMSILSHRPELLAYYQRRGYQLNGNKIPFPNDGNNGEPKREDLELLELEKIVS
ncbi:GNAT family N-acetyltransferase [Psychrobacter sp. N25K4-3-2]|jgi:ribosomal protein S18 acetylase RimI-like enzyme|uniref:GNAT family N-acetyltransferase n=1 Tax=Psychrobacter sp. N25K4-3-2 TaxID=2785026 RepID=UPI001889E40D|nr:GNAT family N-acetyltransferase [Psychrobacter sp. N25K4-3-2]MBF4489048.1 GNAT family N-acetyltransferase [Psychrobacter sp. N25K4-3-2]